MKRASIFSLILLLSAGQARIYGQDTANVFLYNTRLDTIRQAGFYRITLTPELVAKCLQDLADLRIRDEEGRFVPYVVRTGSDPYLAVPDPVAHQRDSNDKHSYITLRFGESYQIDKIELILTGPALYRRQGRIENTGRTVKSFVLDPEHHIIRLPAIRTNRLLIDISNEDNRPLIIQRAACYQSDQYLLAYLQPGAGYQLLAGNAKAVTPEYDLKYFADSSKDVREVRTGPLEMTRIPQKRNIPAGAGNGSVGKDHPKVLLWSIISLVLLTLLYFSVKMVKAISQKEEHDRI